MHFIAVLSSKKTQISAPLGCKAVWLFGSSLALICATSPLHAQNVGLTAGSSDTVTEENHGTEILVTGTRANELAGTKNDTPLIETAQSITVIDNAELTRRGAVSINQALTYVAGVTPNQRGNVASRYDQLFLRGFAPGIYLDGMRLIAGPYSLPQIDFNRVEQVEVVKGPASVLFGSSTPGGLVNLTSKMPTNEASGRIEGTAGNYKNFRGSIDINQPLDKDARFQFRIIGGAQRSDGFIYDTQSERYYISPMLRFSPTSDTDITLITAYQRDPKGAGYAGVPVQGSALPNLNGKFSRNLNTGDPGYEVFDRRQKSVALLFSHQFSDALGFRSHTRYQHTKLEYRQLYFNGFATTGTGVNRNTDFTMMTRGAGGADEDFNTFTTDNHLRLKFATGAIQHNILVGVDYQHIAGENFQEFRNGTAQGVPDLNPFKPVYGKNLPAFPLKQTNTYGKRDQTGIYIQDQVEIGKLHLIASGRYDWYDQSTLNKVNRSVTTLSQTAFTMRFGALYEFDFGLSPYASYSESFEPQSGTLFDGTPFTPVTGRQYEAGLKYQPVGSSTLFTVSAYDLRRQNVPIADPRAGTGTIPVNSQVQIGEVAIRGIEIEGRGEVTPGLDIVLTATYTDAKVTKGTDVAKTGILNGSQGTRPLGIPKWAGSSFISYDFGKNDAATGAVAGLRFGGGVRFVGGSDGTTTYVSKGVTKNERFKTKGFTLVDLMIGYDLGRANTALKGLDLSINANNLLNTRHITSCFFHNGCYFGASRTVLGTVRYSW